MFVLCVKHSVKQVWATYNSRAGSGPWKDSDRPADCIQPYPVMRPEASSLTAADSYALTKLSVRTCETNNYLNALVKLQQSL